MALASLVAITSAERQERPNVLIIYADDLGYGIGRLISRWIMLCDLSYTTYRTTRENATTSPLATLI